MKHLKQLLLFARSIIDKILAKIDPPKPFYPPLTTARCLASTFYPYTYTDVSGNTLTTTYCPTCVGTTADVNVYNQG